MTKYFLRPVFPTLCNGFRNCFAPSCCAEVWEADIVTPNGQVVGNYKNNYPGMIGLRCFLQANNFSLTFPRVSSRHAAAGAQSPEGVHPVPPVANQR